MSRRKVTVAYIHGDRNHTERGKFRVEVGTRLRVFGKNDSPEPGFKDYYDFTVGSITKEVKDPTKPKEVEYWFGIRKLKSFNDMVDRYKKVVYTGESSISHFEPARDEEQVHEQLREKTEKKNVLSRLVTARSLMTK